MNTIEAAVESVRRFEERRKAEGYALGGPGLERVAVLGGVLDSHAGTETQAPAQTVDWSLQAGVTDHGDGRGWVGDDTWECTVGGIVFKRTTPDEAVGAAICHFRDLAWPAIVEAAKKAQADADARYAAAAK